MLAFVVVFAYLSACNAMVLGRISTIPIRGVFAITAAFIILFTGAGTTNRDQWGVVYHHPADAGGRGAAGDPTARTAGKAV